ncbi:MAG: M6 family metalloprotease domain-containing protein [Muribaculaceae bacterium]|nr:M6 family metalloprotease domain-containing protein [Muribaculaceae bacterium]
MKIKHLFAATAVAAMALVSPEAGAVPALNRPIKVTQADGTELTIVKHGDEWFNYVTTVDNHLLMEVDGVYKYGLVDASGRVVASTVKATDARSAAEAAFIGTLDAAAVIDARRSEVFEGRNVARRPIESAPAMVKKVAPSLDGMLTTSFPSTGKQKSIVILVEYTDIKFTIDNAHDYFQRMLNQEGFNDYGCTGSARDYFLAGSGGKFDCDFDVYGPVTLKNNREYYGGNDNYGNDRHAQEMIIEACQQLDPTVDFSQYDRDGDGAIDNVFVFYAGVGEASSNVSSSVWPHSSDIRYWGTYRFDGKVLGNYACSNEWISYVYPQRVDAIGTFVHEFSHVMGLPDLYETSYSTGALTPGDWSILDSGPYCNDGLTPPTYSGFERISLGWLDPVILDGPADVVLEDIFANKAYVIPTEKSTEFFVLENRQQKSYDKYIPGHGMLVWHIDYVSSKWRSNSVNNTASHQYVDLVEANNQKVQSSVLRRGNPFPGLNRVTSFTAETTPALKSWAGKAIDLPLTDIAESNDGVITFKVAGGVTKLPAVTMLPATSVNPRGFTLNWQAVSGAKSYEVTIATGGKVVAAYNGLNVGDVKNCVVTGLEPNTVYTATVVACGLTDLVKSDPSTPLNVTTSPLTFDYVIPTAYTTAHSATEATLAWNAVDGALYYLVDLYSYIPGADKVDFLDFADGYENLPEGWTTTVTMDYGSSMYASEVPALRVMAGQYLQSPVYPNGIKEVSFWCRTTAQGAKNNITVQFLVNGEWVNNTVMSAPSAKTTVTVSDVPAGAVAVKIIYDGTVTGADMGLDDVKVTYVSAMERSYHAGYNAFNVGNVTTHKVTGLDASKEYFFTVTAHNGSIQSMPSAETSLDGSAGVTDVVTDDSTTPAVYYNLQGVQVDPAAGVAPGLYIVRQGSKTSKVIIK